MRNEEEYHRREHERYMQEHRYDIVSLAEEISCAQGMERQDKERAAAAGKCYGCGADLIAGQTVCPKCHRDTA